MPYWGAGGSLLVVAASILLYVGTMKLYPPKQLIIWAAAIIEAIGVVVYVVHLLPQSLSFMDTIAFLLFLTAFILLCLGLTLKGAA